MFSAEFEPADAIENAWQARQRMPLRRSNAEHLLENLTLLLEPGRSVIADAGICLTTVRNRKERPLINGERKVMSEESEDENSTLDSSPLTLTRSLAPDRCRFQYPALDGNLQVVLSSDFTRRARPKRMIFRTSSPARCATAATFILTSKASGVCRIIDSARKYSARRSLALLNCGAYSIAQMFQYNAVFCPAWFWSKKTAKSN